MTGGLFVGQSSADLCSVCASLSPRDSGCHPKPSRQSYNQRSPFTPARGLVSATFATSFTIGAQH